jgi:hypothetical protein
MIHLREVFDKVKTHLLTQGKRSAKMMGTSENPLCMYRAGGGLSCAVGCLIKNEYYNERLEGYTVQTHNVSQALKASGVDIKEPSMADMLDDLQSLHDHTVLHDWASELDCIENKYLNKEPAQCQN